VLVTTGDTRNAVVTRAASIEGSRLAAVGLAAKAGRILEQA
jgi:hypothetical protein